MPKMNRKYSLLLTVLLAGCVTLATNYEALYGPSAPKNRVVAPDKIASAGLVSYTKQVQPILNSRCVVCHSCNDAPCQLDLTSFEGVDRGANHIPVYNGARFSTSKPTRIGIDADSTAAWRAMDFYPVLNERADTRAAHLDNSLLYKALLQKRADAFPTNGRLPAVYAIGTELETDKDSLIQPNACPTVEQYDKHAHARPQWGMPFGLPGLSDQEFKTIETWLAQGSPVEPPPALPSAVLPEIAKWERFLNGPSNKERLMARYVYEHLFNGHLYFEKFGAGLNFTLVRSRTSPGTPIDLIPSVRPYDDPGVSRVYYRLQHHDRTLVDKTHLPYALDDKRLARLKHLFIEAPYTVSELPGYDPKVSSNPFKTFVAIPSRNRYQFMLDNAQFIVGGFAKGSVCRGSIALSVIDDHFWVLFSDPDGDPVNHDASFMAKVSDDLRIPSEREDKIGLLTAWNAYYDYAMRYFLAKVDYLQSTYPKGQGYGLKQIWDGGKTNRNAALTVYRHYDSATVVQGFVGEIPKTGWVLDYPLLERIHYLLVAGFNIYGPAGHQLATRTYMDFLRMESEINFLLFLPFDQRLPLYRQWYRETGQPEKLEKLIAANVKKHGARPPAIQYKTADGKKEFFVKAYQHLGDAHSPPDTINWCREFPVKCAALKQKPRTAEVEKAFRGLSDTKGEITDVFTNVTFVRVKVDGTVQNDLVYTLVRNKSYRNTTALVPTEKSRIKTEDTVDVIRGFLGAYPNFFLELRIEDLQAFVDQYRAIENMQGYDALIDKYGIRRSNPKFWQSSDWFQAKYRHDNPVSAGVFDLSRYQNR